MPVRFSVNSSILGSKFKWKYKMHVFNWNHFEMRLFNLRINFYLLRTFCPHLGSFCVVSSFTTFWSNFTSCPSGPVAQWIEALSLYGSRWVLSEDSGFKSYPSWPEVYLVKNVVWQTTTMEDSNYWGYGYKTQHSCPRSW